MKRQSLGVLLSFAMFAFWAAFAETVDTDRTVTLTADSNTSYEISDSVTLTIEVASGSTWVLSGQITGTGTAKLRKTGLGTLALSNGNNDIPGGIDIAEGTVRADAAGALGSGELRIVQDSTTKGNVTFNVAEAIFVNPITVTGTYKSAAYVLSAPVSTTLKGDITASNGFRAENAAGSTLTFDGAVNTGSGTFYVRPYSGGAYVMNGKVTTGFLELGSAASATGDVYINNPSNRITYFRTYQPMIHCGNTNVLRGSYWTIQSTAGRANGGHILDLHGHDQTMKYLNALQYTDSSTPNANSTLITSDEPCTLTIATDSSTAHSTTGHKLNGAVSLVMDATKKTYTQIFTDVKAGVTTTHSTTGTITVKKGVLKIAGSATTFSGVPQVTVAADGTLNVDSSGQVVFPAVTNFTVNGTLSVGASAGTPFSSGTSSLILGEGASFSIANDTKALFSDVYVEEGGVLQKLAKGTYESSDGRVSQLTAGGFTVVGSSVVDSATWTGAGSDTDVETAENWSEEGVDVTSGILSATFAQAGNTATVSSPVKFNNVTLCAAEGEDSFTFVKGSDGASFAVAGTSLAISDTDSTNRTYAFDVPFEIDGAQTLVASVPANKTLAFRDGFRAKYGAVAFEAGSAVSTETPIPIRMEGSNVVSGSITLPTGLALRLAGTLEAPDGVDQGLAAVDGATTLTVKGGNAYLDRLFGLVLNNASVSKPVCINGNGSYS